MAEACAPASNSHFHLWVSAVAEPETTVVEYREASHLGPHTAVVAVAEMMMLSVVRHSGTQSAAGSLAIRAYGSQSL